MILQLCAAAAVGVGAAGAASLVRAPTKRIAPRVRPYAVVARSALGHAPDATRATSGSRPRDDLALRMRRAGLADVDVDRLRAQQVGRTLLMGVLAGAAMALFTRRPEVAALAAVAGGLVGATRGNRMLERAVARRAGRMRLELFTINQLLAIHARTGAGVMQAVHRVVTRGCGEIVAELSDALTWARSGMDEAEAFRRLAELTPEPSAARTYRLLAAGTERGADLGAGLLALSNDLRAARRQQLHRDAVRRRAAMLVPTIALLAPVMLLFIAAPLPSIVLGHR
ncbi:MAG TPA: type II secretion system F family protein [Acidimicrobiia bacterium]|nr:type II secretion system F family protein [Acidimicrobiia bacterium]